MARMLPSAIAAGLLTLPAPSQGQSADALLDKLVEKGVLTLDEANELRDQADKDFTKAYSVKSGMPEWVTSVKFSGDFRGRFEGFYGDHPGFSDRARWRYRLRAGFTVTMLDDFEVGFRLGSGDIDSAGTITRGSDPISNNQSFQNNGAKKGVFLDTVYARWSPINTGDWTGALTFGKMENPFAFSDLVFDGDYTPEGLAQQIGYTVDDRHSVRFIGGQFAVDEFGSSGKDPFLLGGQARLESVWNQRWSSSFGGSLLGFLNEDQLTSAAVPDINSGNARTVSVQRNATGQATGFTLGAPVEEFETFVVDAALTYTLDSAPLYSGPFPIRLFGEYLQNLGTSDQNRGYQAGITFGKAGKRRTWELTYRWKFLEGDAWWEELTDSDSGGFYEGPFQPAGVPAVLRSAGTGYGSGTNVRGHWLRAGYSPYDSITLNLTFISLDLIEEYLPGTLSHMNRLQVDAVWKF